MLWQRFQDLRGAYDGFKRTLTPGQLSYGANDLADLEDGLDILQEAFSAYQDDAARGQSEIHALHNLCQVLHQGVVVWMQQLDKDSSRLRVGW